MATPRCGRCGNFRAGEPYTLDQCRTCWLIHHDEAHAKHFRVEGDERPLPPRMVAVSKCCGDVGPGTELTKLLKELGISPKDCACDERAKAMNLLGVDGCRREFDTIVDWLRTEQFHASWRTWARAAGVAILTGLAFQLDPFDPAPGLLREAIRRATG